MPISATIGIKPFAASPVDEMLTSYGVGWVQVTRTLETAVNGMSAKESAAMADAEARHADCTVVDTPKEALAVTAISARGAELRTRMLNAN